MHFQQSTPGWKTALLEMPDGAVLKAFDAGLLKDGKESWAAAGRNPRQLITVLRHFDVYTAPEGTLAEAREHWRAMFRRYLDGTFFDRFAPFVDIFSESNEYTAASTWTDATEAAKALRNMQAVTYVFNGEYRGRWGIRPDARVAIMAGPVSNAWPRSVTQLAVSTDSYLDYHAYELCLSGVRAADSWRNHSGLWHFIEQRDGLKPLWIFGEAGPYRDAEQGWRHPLCLGHDEAKLIAVMEAWWRDIAATAAYREGRIAGPGCFFTSGGVGWPYYQLDTPQLLKLARACRALWKPGTPAGDDNVPITTEDLKAIDGHAAAIRILAAKYLPPPAPPPWWATKVPPYKLAATGKVVNFYNADGTSRTVAPISRAATGQWDVFTVNVALGLLRITNFMDATRPDWWCRGADVTPLS